MAIAISGTTRFSDDFRNIAILVGGVLVLAGFVRGEADRPRTKRPIAAAAAAVWGAAVIVLTTTYLLQRG